jgi:hypothetical protein
MICQGRKASGVWPAIAEDALTVETIWPSRAIQEAKDSNMNSETRHDSSALVITRA